MATHFAHEEADLEPFVAGVKDSEPWKRAEQAIRRDQSLPQAAVFLAWLQEGADADALRFLRTEIPAPVLLLLPRLLGRAYTRGVAPVWR